MHFSLLSFIEICPPPQIHEQINKSWFMNNDKFYIYIQTDKCLFWYTYIHAYTYVNVFLCLHLVKNVSARNIFR